MKNNFFLLAFALLALSILFTACSAPKVKCIRTDNVGYWNLGAELNKVYNCPQTKFYCGNNIVPSEFVVLYDLPNPWEMVTTSQVITNKSFTISEQNQIIQTAKNTASANAPNCASGAKKSVYDIQFYHDFLTDNNNQTLYAIRIRVTYACCSGGIPK